ncbi:MAG: segregation/condensation protein A, partial [Firmicutes bacterium]|nr:segregation/condensation protein A [Bacillota bacterium]
KARALFAREVPSGDNPELEDTVLSEEELARRLLQYRAYRDAAQQLAQRARAHVGEVTRLPLSLSEFRTLPTVAQAVGNITLGDLAAALAAALERARPPLPVELRQEDEPIEMRVARVLRIVRSGPKTFGELVGNGSRRDVVGVFLALLELLRQGAVRCEQERMFGEIWITATT